MYKKYIVPFGIVVIVVLLLSIRPIIKVFYKPPQPAVNQHPVYDKVILQPDEESLKHTEKLKATIQNPESYIFQTYSSGTTAALYIPKELDASPSAYIRGSIDGLQVSTVDYYLTLFHILKLDNSKEFCNQLSIKNYHSAIYTKDQRKLDTKKASTMSWELADKNHTSIEQINSCYIDGQNAVWIMDMYFPKKIFDARYKQSIQQIVDNFTFVH